MNEWTEQQRYAIGEAIRTRRLQLGLSQSQAVDQGQPGISAPVWSILENGRQGAYKRRTLSAVTRALGWTPDSIDRLLRGEPAIVVNDGPGTTTATAQVAAFQRTDAGRDFEINQLHAGLSELQALVTALALRVEDLARVVVAQGDELANLRTQPPEQVRRSVQ